MNYINLSKSKYCKARQCNKILWLDKNKPEEMADIGNESVLENGTKVGELARSYFGKYTNIEFNKDLSKMISDTEKELKNVPNIITEASFNFDNNFCSIDILKNDIDGIEIYEVKSSTGIHDIYFDDVSYQYYVLNNLGFNIKSVHIMYINSEYVRNGELELDKLFNINDVTEIAISKQNEIQEKIKEINEYMQKYDNGENEPEKKISMNCFDPYECAYWNYCTKGLPKNNVFDIRSMQKNKKFKLFNEGKISFEDIVYEDINEKYLEQIDFELNDKAPKIEKDKIKDFLDTLSYPLYFLDFETFQQVIPEYDGVNPYMQIPFQYSLHYIEKEDGELKHKEFLAEAGTDPRRKLAERLVADIPKNVCVTAYNMSFEKSVIKKLAETYPDLSEHLLNIRENIKDLMIPFKERYYYCKAMQGSYSIKYVLPALFPNDPELDYHNLPVVHNGGEASFAYSDLVNHTKEEQEEIRNGLLVYCGLDTLAMVKVWEKLKGVEEMYMEKIIDYKNFEELIKNPVIKNVKKNMKNKTIFEVTKYPYREKVSSNIFAFYFDINEEHNWQDIFLEALFNAMNEIYHNTYKLKVDTEFLTEKGKYIDIVLTGNDFVIGIENKINASLYNDLEDYYKKIKSIAEEEKITKIYAIVLSANKLSDVDKKKIEELKKIKITYKHILYSELFDKIDILLTEKNIKDNKWLIFYKEFKKTIIKRNDKNMIIDENLRTFYDKNKDEIKNLTNCLYDLKDKLNKKADKLQEEIEKKLNEKNINLNNFVVGHWNYNQNINIFDDNNNLYTICNIDLKEYKITIDNVITPKNWYIQIYTKATDRDKILKILKKNGLKCKNSDDQNHIKLIEYYDDGNNEIIEKDIELIKIFEKELNSKNIKE